MKTLSPFFIILSFVFISINVQATHLMGGNMTYTYIGVNPNNTHTYQVTLKIYRYCTGSTATLDQFAPVGVYAHDPNFPNANKQLVITINVPLISQSFIQPPSSNPNCGFTTTACVEEGIYQTNIALPASTGGYHLMHDRCCRNNNIANLSNPGGTGQAYYAFIPPTSVVNSSPTFAIAPVPFMCANDTTSILNAAFDPDGDSLVYSFEIPYFGISSSGNAQPNPPVSYPWPISQVTYSAGYSFSQPFGSGGYTSINPSTGLTTYFSPSTGFFVIAVEIKEYRNGVLIGITRRDLQIIVISCPPNPAPVLSTTGGSGQTTVTIQEGATICFPVTFNDPNQDSLYITAAGPIFNSSSTNPPATFTPASGIGSASGQFCWTTSCQQGSSTPYQFVVTATDNGCPAKITNVVYTINVVPMTTPAITGPDTICQSQTANFNYSVVNTPGYTYNWIINGGTQTAGGNTNAISVNWTSVNGSVSVNAVNSAGCVGDTIVKNVISLNPVAAAGPDLFMCPGQTATLGAPGNSFYTYQWSPATGLSNPNIANPVFTATTGQIGVELFYQLTVSALGCTATDVVEITVYSNPNVTFASPGNQCINGNPVTLTGGSPAGGVYSGNGVSNGVFSPSAAGVGNHIITYNYVASTGCSAVATAHIIVSALPVISLTLPDTVNMNDPGFVLTGGQPSGGVYSGNGVSGGMFDPSVAGTGWHTITYTYTQGACTVTASAQIFVDLIIVALDPFAPVCVDAGSFALTGGSPAGGTYSGPGVTNGMFDPSVAGVGTHTITYSYPNGVPATSTITVNPLPTASVTVAPAIGCQSNTIFTGYGPQDLLLTATSATAVSYQWFLDGVMIPGATASTHQATVAGTYSVQVTDANGCMSDLSAQAVITNINVVDVRCGNGLKKIILCHVPPGNIGNPQTLCIAPSAIPAHLANHPYDCIGPCSLYYSDMKTALIEDIHYHLTPNPATDKTELSFMVFNEGHVKIELIDFLGKKINTIFNETIAADIEKSVLINTSEVKNGIYFIRIQSPDGVVTEKLTVVR